MLCNIKPVPFHESDKYIFAKIPGGGGGPDPRSPPSGSAHVYIIPPLIDCHRMSENMSADGVLKYAFNIALAAHFCCLTLSQTTNFKLFQTERVCRRQFQI